MNACMHAANMSVVIYCCCVAFLIHMYTDITSVTICTYVAVLPPDAASVDPSYMHCARYVLILMI